MVTRLLWVAVAGAAGTLARYALGGLVHRVLGLALPWGTLVVNLTGCFLFGLVWSLGEGEGMLSREARAIVLAGFLGALTTFSAFAFETAEMLRDGRYAAMAAYLAAQNGLGVVALLGGFAAGRVVCAALANA